MLPPCPTSVGIRMDTMPAATSRKKFKLEEATRNKGSASNRAAAFFKPRWRPFQLRYVRVAWLGERGNERDGKLCGWLGYRGQAEYEADAHAVAIIDRLLNTLLSRFCGAYSHMVLHCATHSNIFLFSSGRRDWRHGPGTILPGLEWKRDARLHHCVSCLDIHIHGGRP